MRLILHVALLALLLAPSLLSAQTCHYGQGEKGLQADLSALNAAPSCRAAYALYQRCLWGSSADVDRAATVESRCKAAIPSKPTAAQQAVINAKYQLCQDRYAGRDGTLAMSEASSCDLEVTVALATDFTKAVQPLPRASFDCTLAKTPTEHAVCDDPTLGRYDLLLSQAYKSFLGELKLPARQQLLLNQRQWLRSTPTHCGVKAAPVTPKALACLRSAYHQRLGALDSCSDGANVACLTNAEARTQPGLAR